MNDREARIQAILARLGITSASVFVGGGTVSIQVPDQRTAELIFGQLNQRQSGAWELQEMTWLDGNPWQVINK